MRNAWISCVLLLAACSAAERPPARGTAPSGPAAPATVHAGWYLEHAGQPRFQPCGQSQPLPIVAAADLPARAKAFGLADDTPVYVRVTGTIAGGEVRVAAVEQFGSPTPVRDCGLTGVVSPETGH